MSVFRPLTIDDLETGGYDTVIVCAPDMAGRAKQMRFLITRGFAPDVARRLCGGLDER